jgi:hypothetical protein
MKSRKFLYDEPIEQNPSNYQTWKTEKIGWIDGHSTGTDNPVLNNTPGSEAAASSRI